MTTIADLSGHHIGRRVRLTMQDGGVTHVGDLTAIYHYRTNSHLTIRYDTGAEWKPGYSERLTGDMPITLLDAPASEDTADEKSRP